MVRALPLPHVLRAPFLSLICHVRLHSGQDLLKRVEAALLEVAKTSSDAHGVVEVSLIHQNDMPVRYSAGEEF